MTEQRLSNCILPHIHKKVTDELHLVSVAKKIEVLWVITDHVVKMNMVILFKNDFCSF